MVLDGLIEFLSGTPRGTKQETVVPPSTPTPEQLTQNLEQVKQEDEALKAWNNQDPHPADNKLMDENQEKISNIEAEINTLSQPPEPTPPTNGGESVIPQIPVAEPTPAVSPSIPEEKAA